MFGLFAAKCPLNTGEKAWTESRMLWLADRLGIERLRHAEVILPTEEFFPGPYGGTAENVQDYFERVRRHMGVANRDIKLEICPDVQLPGAAGHYHQGPQTVIRIAESQLANPMSMIATLAHELSHEILLGGGLLTSDVSDHEMVTDLVPVYLGMGIFAANSTVQEEHGRMGQWSWWSVGKHGYLPARIFGYALALFAFMRGDRKPTWPQYLRLDASSALVDGLRYLQKTDDSMFHPNAIGLHRSPPSKFQLADDIRDGTPSARLVAIWEAENRTLSNPEIIAALTECLSDRDSSIAGAAGRALAALGPAATPALPQLIKALSASHEEPRAGAAQALGVLGKQPELVVPALVPLLADRNRTVVSEAALALSKFGLQAESASRGILAALTKALIEVDESQIEILIDTLRNIAADPKKLIVEHFTDDDDEFRRRALNVLKQQVKATQGNSN